ncbi:hypothetical protein [Sphingomonas sp. OTU376]|uniref:hypothetical protein n=1 Tax=Sphingomonas sp. OTU376 TaxID=3043863 RepID=UPI00313D7B5C
MTDAAENSDGRRWSWWAGEMEKLVSGPRAGDWGKPEVYTVNEATRDAVILAARAEFGSEATIHIVEATQDGAFITDLFEPDDRLLDAVFDRFAEQNGDRFGEDGFQGDLSHEDLAAALNAALASFIGERESDIVTWRFTEQRNGEVIAAEPSE